MRSYLKQIWKSPFSFKVSNISILGTDNLVSPYSFHKACQDREIKRGVRGRWGIQWKQPWMTDFVFVLFKQNTKPPLTQKQQYKLKNGIMESVEMKLFNVHWVSFGVNI